jgi:hypothetical protein
MSASQSDRINYRAEAQVLRRSLVLNAPLLRVWNALATSDGFGLLVDAQRLPTDCGNSLHL